MFVGRMEKTVRFWIAWSIGEMQSMIGLIEGVRSFFGLFGGGAVLFWAAWRDAIHFQIARGGAIHFWDWTRSGVLRRRDPNLDCMDEVRL